MTISISEVTLELSFLYEKRTPTVSFILEWQLVTYIFQVTTCPMLSWPRRLQCGYPFTPCGLTQVTSPSFFFFFFFNVMYKWLNNRTADEIDYAVRRIIYFILCRVETKRTQANRGKSPWAKNPSSINVEVELVQSSNRLLIRLLLPL